MIDYYKVYLQKDGEFVKKIAKRKEEVRQIIQGAEGKGYYKYVVVGHIKGEKSGADTFAESGYFTEEARVVLVDRLDVDYEIVAGSVVIDGRGKSIRENRGEER